jgi:hypothetical protein
MNDLIADITKLTETWYKLIGSEHHKDRDCHWKISTLWSYGNPPVYCVEHSGYIRNHINIPCASYTEALSVLKAELERAISEEKEFQSLEIDQAYNSLQAKKNEEYPQ